MLTHYPWRSWIPYRFFLDLDPFTVLASFQGTRHFIVLALLFLLVGVLAGRLFCGYACPLGFCIDLMDYLLGRTAPARSLMGSEKREQEKEVVYGELTFPSQKGVSFAGIQWIVLGVLVIGLLFHNSLPFALDPLALLMRSITVIFYPLVIWVANSVIGLFRPIAEHLGWYGLAYLSFAQPGFEAAVDSFLILLLVFGLSLLRRRFWCRYLCPLGALLGLLAKIAPMRRSVSTACTQCGQCRAVCPMGAIEEDPFQTNRVYCIQCRSCSAVCPEDAVSFPMRSFHRDRPADFPEGLSRRGFFLGVGAGGVLVLLTRLDPRVMKRSGRWLRPPGAIPEEDFLAACIRCGACVRICMTHTLQASGMETGLIRWGTPIPNMRFAGCEQQCNLCGKVCPTGAIRNLPLKERQHAKMGTAVLFRERCVAWARDRLCLLCDEACPYNAVVFKNVEGHKRPFVDESRCNGCGICETVCPVEGEAAIIVYPDGELRLKEGSYKKALNEKRIFLKPKQDLLEPSPLATEYGNLIDKKGKI